jgi:MFS family permease
MVACFCAIFTAYTIRAGYGILLPEMLPSLGISKTEAGVIFSSYFTAYTVASPLLGLMGDRYSVRTLMTLFAAILGAGTFLMAYSSSLIQATLFFTLAGIGTAAFWAPVVALVQKWSADKHRGKILGFVTIGSSLGIMGSSAAMPTIVATYSWRAGWMSLGSLGFALAAISFLMIRNPPQKQPEPCRTGNGQPATAPVNLTYLSLLRDGKFWLIGMAYLFASFSSMVPFTFLSTYAVQDGGLTYEAAVRLVTMMGLGALVGKLILSPLSDRTGRIQAIMLCTVLTSVGLLGMTYGKGTLILSLFTALYGIGWGPVWALYGASASDYFSKESAGSIVGLWTLYLGAGAIVSPIAAGWIADTTGSLVWSFAMGTAGSILSLLLLVPVWQKSRRALLPRNP